MDKDKVVYKELSYKIMGAVFEVFKELGYGFKERYYEDAIAEEFSKNNITQAFQYLKVSNLKLAILVNITSKGVKFKRILNIN